MVQLELLLKLQIYKEKLSIKHLKKNDLNWVWTKKIYKILLNKSGGKDRISNYALQKKVSVDAERLRNLKTKIFNDYLKKKKIKT